MAKTTGEVAKNIEALRAEINRHNHSYHVLDKPQISDREFDRLMQELIDLEKANPDLMTADSPTQRVGGDVQSELKSVRHTVPMMSIDNTYNEEEVRAFDARVRKALDGQTPEYVLEPKIDGTSVSLRYEKGVLVLAATRGRGNLGEDITINARTIKSIPLRLHEGDVKPPPVMEVRGEVYMDNEDFQRVNKEIVAQGEEPYQNPRNTTAGTVRRLDPKIVAKRRLKFLSHGLGEVNPMPVDNYWDWTGLLRKWGLPLPTAVTRAKSIDEVIAQIEAFAKVRPSLPYMTDGIVIKVNSFSQRDILGATSKAPRWVIAFKYETEQQPTVLKDVRWQVGKGGNLTPVGDLEPVFIGGVTVTHASLHNIDQIRRLDIHLGDTLIIERSGEVIPYVVQVDVSKRPRGAKPIEPPKKCPSCGEPVEKEADTPYIRCQNPACVAQFKEKLRWYCGRSQMDIEGLGDKIVDQLVDRGLVKTFADLYKVKSDEIAELAHEVEVGKKTASKIVNAISTAKSHGTTFQELHSSFGEGLEKQIERMVKQAKLTKAGLGDKTIRQLVQRKMLKSPSDIFKLTVPQLAGLTREVKVGDKTAQKIIKSISNSKARGLSHVLAGIGIRHVGTTIARDLAAWAGDVEKLSEASIEDLRRAVSGSSGKDDSVQKVKQVSHALYVALRATKSQLHQGILFESVSTSTKSYLENTVKKFRLASRIREGRIDALSEKFPTTADLFAATEKDLFECISGRKVIAESVYQYLHSTQGWREIHGLQQVGVKLNSDKPNIATNTMFTGKTVVITGTFPGYSRDDLAARLRGLGATVTGSVSKNTNIVLVGDEPGSKFTAAQKLGVTIWNIEKTLRELGDLSGKANDE